MDGLDCQEILLTNIENNFTLGAEYYGKNFVHAVEQVQKCTHVDTLGKISKTITDGDHGSSEYQDEGVLYLLSECVHEGYLDFSKARYISKEKNNTLKRSALHPGDVVVTKTGAYYGKSAVIPENIKEANMIAHVGKLELHDGNNPYYVSTFLNCKYGYYQLRRRGLKATRPEIKLIEFPDILIPKFGNDLEILIEKTVKQAISMLNDADSSYDDAGDYLLKEIGIDMNPISNGGVSVKSFSESFGKTGRLDAEYYQPKYNTFEQLVRSYKDGVTTPENEFDYIKDKCSRELPEYPYVEIGDINIRNGTAEFNIVATEELPANAKIMTKSGDLLISTVRPYRGAVAILSIDNLLVSGAFTVLREKGTYPAETLQILLRTALYKDWLLKYNVGSSYPVIKDEDVLNIPIPILSADLHQKILDFVQESHDKIRRAERLLESAKQAVEMTIEQNEITAITWLKAKMDELTKDV